MKYLQRLSFSVLIIFSAHSYSEIKIEAEKTTGQINFAVNEIKSAAKSSEHKSDLTIQFKQDSQLESQAYRINFSQYPIITIRGGDDTGLMYGGIELSEQIEAKSIINSSHPDLSAKPYIKSRGLKFNIPLDIRNPSYQDAGDAAQQNIVEMWNFEFWTSYLDMMARNRYNVLTLWNPHPFPSMVKLDKYPEIALQDVHGSSFPLDTDREDEPVAKFIVGSGISKQVLDNQIVLKKISIEDKITFWRNVMKYAKSRGVDVYFITWNIWMNGIAPPGWYREQQNIKETTGPYGINNNQDNPNTIAYLRESVKEFILTYPDLAGIGITAGENMEDRDDEFDREKWLWKTYGEGILAAKKIQPERTVKFIHRYWQSGVEKLHKDFIDKYPDPINLSFKYARARMYATAAPRWADEYIEEIRQFDLKSWWNIRNDDIFFFRWGDHKYASEFFKNIPSEQVTAGYFMGSDGYVWGREFSSNHPQSPRELEIDKHWYNFMLWGRMGYDPDLPETKIKAMVAKHYPQTPIEKLLPAWASASKIPSLVTKFHWHDWDFMWSVEGCLDLRKGFHTVNDFINNPPMVGSTLISITDAISALKQGKELSGTTPLQVSEELERLAHQVLVFTREEHMKHAEVSESYRELIYDLDAWAYMGHYYANKIRGAYHLHAYRSNLNTQHKAQSIAALEVALTHWKSYAAAATRNYKPQFLAKTRTVDWVKLTEEVMQDIEIAKQD